MYDMHNDLLTLAYLCYIKDDYSPLIEFNNKIKKGNVEGIVANLYFMSKEEMRNELGEEYYTNESIIKMFTRSKSILNKYIPNVSFLYSIEGCDYIDIDDLYNLKKEGLNSILLVWNNPNKYGSGNRDNYGLTKLGIEFINKAIKLGIGIDLSHANERTFDDIYNIVINRYDKVYASHSNIKSIFNHNRNLSDEQLYKLKNLNGKLGLVATNLFVKDIDEYIEHIKYSSDILGVDNIMISSDNMDYLCKEYRDTKLFEYENMYNTLKNKLKKYFNEEEINKILYNNSNRLFKLIRSE